MDEDWQISFRIHSASTYIENSLKFDIQQDPNYISENAQQKEKTGVKYMINRCE